MILVAVVFRFLHMYRTSLHQQRIGTDPLSAALRQELHAGLELRRRQRPPFRLRRIWTRVIGVARSC